MRLQYETPEEKRDREYGERESRRMKVRRSMHQALVLTPEGIERQKHKLHKLAQQFGTRRERKILTQEIEESKNYWQSKK